MMVFKQIVNRVAKMMQVGTGVRYATQEIPDFVQQAYHDIWFRAPWPQTVAIDTLTLAASSNILRLPKKYHTIIRAKDTANESGITVRGAPEFSDFNLPDLSDTTGSLELSPMDAGGVETQLSSAGTLKVKSSDAADVSIEAFVRGRDSLGQPIAETITTNASNGTTAVAGTVTFTTIEAFTKGPNTTGNIILTTSADVELARIGRFERSPLYKAYKANITPATSRSITALLKLNFVPFLNNLDVAFTDMDDCLMYKAIAIGWHEHRQTEQSAMWESRFEVALDTLVASEFSQDGAIRQMAPIGRA